MAVNKQILGKVVITNKDEYNSSNTYEILDVVSYKGSSYLSKIDNNTSVPTDNEKWQLIAKKGDTYEVTEEDLQAIAKQITDDANSIFNTNVDSKTNNFNDSAEEKLSTFNANARTKLNDYNSNAKTKLDDYNANDTSKLKNYNDNATSALEVFNTNASTKLIAYNDNTVEKLAAYNNNANSSLKTYNDNATTKTDTFDTNAENKTDAFNTNAQDKTDEFNSTANAEKITSLSNEFYRVKDNILETGEVTDTSIHLEDSALAEMQEIEIEGATEQEITQGYQLLKLPIKNGSANGLTWNINEDGTLVLNGTTTANTHIRTEGFKIPASENEKITLSATGLTNIINVGFKNALSGANVLVVSNDSPQNTILLTNNDLTNADMLDMYITSNKTFNNQVVKIMLNKGDVAYAFEPFTNGETTPSPNFPKQIKNVNGLENVFDFKVWYDNRSKIYHTNGDLVVNNDSLVFLNPTAKDQYCFNTYHASTTPTEGQKNIINTYGINVENTKKVKISYKNENLCLSQVNLFFYDKDYKYLNGNYTSPSTAFICGAEFSVPTGAKYMCVRFDNEGFGTNVTTLKVSDITILKDNNSIATMPYGHWLPIKLMHKNVFNHNLANKSTLVLNGITSTWNNDTIHCKGTATASYANITNAIYHALPIGTYTFSISTSNALNTCIKLNYEDGTNEDIVILSGTISKTFTVNKPVMRYYFFLSKFSVGDEIDISFKIQIEKGQVAADCESCEEKIYLYDLNKYDKFGNIVGNYEIASLNNSNKDKLTIKYNNEDGNWHLLLIKKVGKYVITGDENWVYYAPNKIFYFDKVNVAASAIQHPISSHYIGGAYNTNNRILIDSNGRLHISDYRYDNVADFKTYLSTNNVDVYYLLETPYTIDLGIVDMPLTYNEVTNIFVDSDLLPNINVKYYRNFTKTIQNLQVNEKALKQELIDINNRLTALENTNTSIVDDNPTINDNEVTEE